MIQLQNFNQFIKQQAIEQGFAICGMSALSKTDDENDLRQWLSEGRNADMDWFNRNTDVRTDPTLLVEDAQTIISFAYSYPIVSDSNIASYAHATDYHYTLKEKLNRIIENINTQYNVTIKARAFTDSAPIRERYWAQKSGLGWIGKSGMLINRRIGSNTLLCEIICDVRSDKYDLSDPFNGCGKCRRCIKECPTGAICNDKTVDSRLCTSYLTIEHRGEFSASQLETLSRSEWLYGCDVCLICCPWNKQPTIAPLLTIDHTIVEMTNREFKYRYENTPLERVGLKNIVRNYVREIL